MSTSQELPDSMRIVAPLRLIFWGTIICIVDFRLNGFDIVNNFIGMLLILWGVVALSCVSISDRYRQRMVFPVVMTVLATIGTFFTEVLLLRVSVFPSGIDFAIAYTLSVFVGVISLVSIIVFCRCMAKYCTVMNWEHALASWKYQIRLNIYGVLIPSIILAIPLSVFISSLKFVPKNSQPSLSGWTVNFGEWVALVDETTAMVTVLPMILFVLVVVWTVIHFLISLSRMIHAAKGNKTTEPQS